MTDLHLLLSFGALCLTLLIDMLQTLTIYKSNGIWKELNPILNWKFKPWWIVTWFFLCAITNGLATLFIPLKFSFVVIGVFTLVESYWICRNYKNGIRI